MHPCMELRMNLVNERGGVFHKNKGMTLGLVGRKGPP